VIFVDAGAFIARYKRDDDDHDVAVEGWRRIGATRRSCVTTNFVFAEAVTLIGRYFDYRFAAARARAMLDSPTIQIVRPTGEDEAVAVDVMEKYADHDIGFVDCVSFVVMKRLRLRDVFGFDRHFPYAGFRLWPAK
jgi:predicted nucleic acid-binding protein